MRLSPLPGRPLPLVAPGPSAPPSGPEPLARCGLCGRDGCSSPGPSGSLAPTSSVPIPESLLLLVASHCLEVARRQGLQENEVERGSVPRPREG